MKEFEICKITSEKYDGFLLCLTFESILTYLDRIEYDPLITDTKNGTLLIDQLLVAGNGRNRYICCSYRNGKIDISTTKNVYPTESYKKISLSLLQRNLQLLKNSILTDTQKDSIINGIAF